MIYLMGDGAAFDSCLSWNDLPAGGVPVPGWRGSLDSQLRWTLIVGRLKLGGTDPIFRERVKETPTNA